VVIVTLRIDHRAVAHFPAATDRVTGLGQIDRTEENQAKGRHGRSRQSVNRTHFRDPFSLKRLYFVANRSGRPAIHPQIRAVLQSLQEIENSDLIQPKSSRNGAYQNRLKSNAAKVRGEAKVQPEQYKTGLRSDYSFHPSGSVAPLVAT
jgi:hypothetical protein